jgi:lambda family phage portal protein
MGLLAKIFTRSESAADRAAWLNSTLDAACGAAHESWLRAQRQAQRSFETAETPAWTESWPTHAAPINDDLARQLPTLWARAAGLARNNEWAQRYLIELDDGVLGPNGMPLQMRLTHANGKARDAVTNNLIESLWRGWGDQACEVSGLTWPEVETLALHTLARRGELLYRLRPNPRAYLGFQIQMLDPMLLDVSLNRDYGGNRIRMGKEIDNDGLPVAFWLLMAKTGDSPGQYVTMGRHVRIPAAEIRHHYLVEEPGQLRGIPWLSVGARRLWMLKDFEEAAAVASSNAAKRQGFFYTPTGEAPTIADTIVNRVLDAAEKSGKVLSPEEVQQLQAAADKFVTTVPGQFDTLPQGTQFAPFESKWPEVSAEGYIKGHVRAWAAARGMSYVSIGNDLESVNYSSAQVGILSEREHLKKTQIRLRNWLHRQVLPAWLPWAVLSTSGLSFERVDDYQASATWQMRRWSPLDPLKQAKADEVNLRLNLTSRRRVQLRNGDDPDEIATEVAEEEKLYGPIKPAPVAGLDGGKEEDDDADDDDDDKDERAARRKFLA